MSDFSAFGLLGLCIGFLWGIGCSLAILYSIYLGGYRKAVRDSLEVEKPRRFQQAIEKIRSRQKQEAERGSKGTERVS
ncbi:MAG TPA: hypothetical protein VK574_01455 [Terracidiphilus sp.]|jgi:hypothetical protein|nr:hypothetical protein [Terracidiphilus sp.]